MISTLTVGQVSAIIAASVFVVQFLLPNAVSLILAGILHHTHSAVTWSVVQRSFLSSHWPLILSTDAVASKQVDTKVRFVTFAKPFGLLLVSLAAVITPIGLHDAVVPSKNQQLVSFAYLHDSGPFGSAPMSRNGRPFTRECGSSTIFLACPGSKTELDIKYDRFGDITNTSLKAGTTYDVNVPEDMIKLYQSGLANHPRSVASFFDIEHRLFTSFNASSINNGQKYLVNYFRMMESVVMDNTIKPVEGLIVDSVTGGVGFRNHTVPTDVGLGAEWTEDILFIEPETQCVNTNLTLEFTVGPSSTDKYSIQNLALVDEGGFANLVQEYPEIDYKDPQKDAQLSRKAYKAAWLTNAWIALYLNVTRPNPNSFAYLNSQVGKRFPLQRDMSRYAGSDGIVTTANFEDLVNPDSVSLSSNSSRTRYPNPFGMTSRNFTSIQTVCAGAGNVDLTNATNIHVQCGLLFGAAQPKNGGEVFVADPFSAWRQPVYACASAVKTSIKEVQFKYNATMGDGLSTLSILNVSEKQYTGEATMPLWGIENVDFQLDQLTQLWGLISDDRVNSANLTTIRAPQIYLPGFKTLVGDRAVGYQYLPGYTGPQSALTGVYDTILPPYDWSGGQNIALLQKWRKLSANAGDASEIINLIWTDIASNTMTSSRSWLADRVELQKRDDIDSTSKGQSFQVPVTTFERRIQYQWAFAVPAFITLLFAGAVFCIALIFSFSKKAGGEHIRFYLHHLSAGRLLGALYYPNAGDMLADTNSWIMQVGRYPTTLRASVPSGQRHGPNDTDGYQSASANPVTPEGKFEAVTLQTMPARNYSGEARHGYNGYVKVDS